MPVRGEPNSRDSVRFPGPGPADPGRMVD